MARASNRLTAVGIAKAKKPGMLPDGHGLYLQVSLTGGKSWIFRYKRAGTTHDLGLGPLHTASLADARLAALDLRISPPGFGQPPAFFFCSRLYWPIFG